MLSKKDVGTIFILLNDETHPAAFSFYSDWTDLIELKKWTILELFLRTVEQTIVDLSFQRNNSI